MSDISEEKNIEYVWSELQQIFTLIHCLCTILKCVWHRSCHVEQHILQKLWRKNQTKYKITIGQQCTWH